MLSTRAASPTVWSDPKCDFRVGGAWNVEFGPSEEEIYQHRHVFKVIDRPRRLLFTTTETRLDGCPL